MTRSRPLKVLVADDSPTVTDILQYLFTEEGYDVVVAQDGVFAIKEFYSAPPDLLILDVEMPRMDGYQVCRMLKDDYRISAVPIIILTSHDAQSDRFHGLSAGADSYLIKNLEDGRLLTEAKRLIQQSPWINNDPVDMGSVSEEEILHRLNNMLDRRLFIASVVNQLQEISGRLVSLDNAMDNVLELFSQIFEFAVGGIVIPTGKSQLCRIVIVEGFAEELVSQLIDRMRNHELPDDMVVSDDIQVKIRRIEMEKAKLFPKSEELASSHIWPLQSHGQTIGLIGMGGTSPTKFDQSGHELIREFITHASMILDNAHLLYSLGETNAELQNTLTELRTTQTQLIQSEKMASLGQLTAGLVHEMNNPMNFIAGNLEHLENYTKDLLGFAERAFNSSLHESRDSQQDGGSREDLDFIREDLPDMISDMREGVVRAKNIINDLRTFSSGDRGEALPTDLKEVVESALNIVHYQWKDKILIIKNYSEIPIIECNTSQIGQVVLNLITNAIDALKDVDRKGEIEINLSSDDKWVQLEVKDNGSGIEKSNLDSLFQPFFTTKDVGSGMGLGLSISQSIVKSHGGDIDVSSASKEGTTFTIKLPLKTEESRE